MGWGMITTLQYITQKTEADDYIALVLLLLSCSFYILNCTLWSKPSYHHIWFDVPHAKGRADRKNEQSSRNITARLKGCNDIAIIWGSQSGTAEGFANRLAKECKARFGRDAVAVDISDIDPETLAEIPNSKLAIFIFSTYGDGDPSDNSSDFLRWLTSNSTHNFSNLRYAAFGLGNSNYKYYNRVIDIIVKSLDHLGATAIHEIGKADDSGGQTEDDFVLWKQNLFEKFKGTLGFQEIPLRYEPAYRILEDMSLDVIDLNLGEPTNTRALKTDMSNSGVLPLDIKDIGVLFSTSSNRGCLHIEIDITDHPEVKYTTGDHLAVWPCNPTSEVNRLLSVLQLGDRSKIPLLINSIDSSASSKIPSPTTVETIFRYYLEICHPVSKETIFELSTFAPSQTSKERLLRLTEKTQLAEFCSKTYNTLGCILESVIGPNETWSALPLSFILETLPRLTPRYYSISSSSIVQPRSVAITVSTSSTNENLEPIPGVMTNYFRDLGRHIKNEAEPPASAAQLEPMYNLSGPSNILDNHRIFAQVCKSKFRLPTVAKHPVIMVAAGSGIAPFRGFLIERSRLSSIGREVGRSLLFFGCRNEEEYLYRKELSELTGDSNTADAPEAVGSSRLHSTVEVITAFSRQLERKEYVQDRILEYKQTVCQLLLKHDASLYICGSAKMARDVAQRLGECLKEQMAWDEAELKQWSEHMKKYKKWQEDVWK